ncbi:MAG: Maf family protein [Clostridiales bacterium]|nr:Maf family protein [Clostridiales bacterium]MCD8160335.1 Maf family protein [Clostridiales bacterium]
MMKLILASQSPRRKALLEQMGFRDFETIPAQGKEEADPTLPPEEYVERLALHKAREVAKDQGEDAVVIGADTVVVLDGHILGKPKNAAEALQMLNALSGRKHLVHTGVAVVCGDEVELRHETTKVTFCTLTQREMLAYIATGEPMDKAGAYGIQGRGALFIDKIEGDYYNVVGLPISCLNRMLGRFGVQSI